MRSNSRERAGQWRFTCGALSAVVALVLLGSCSEQPTGPNTIAVAIDSVSPAVGTAGQVVHVRILGAGFVNGTTATVERDGSTLENIAVFYTTFISGSEVIATVGIGVSAAPALYDLKVVNPDGSSATAGGILTVLVESPPIVVLAAEPAAAGPGERLEVRISGFGFKEGDQVVWERNDSIDPDMVVAETRYIGPSELVATLQVGQLAVADRRNVVVSRPRKRGIGTEMFVVLPGTGAELTARFSFTYDGYRSGSFNVNDTFVLDPVAIHSTNVDWGLTYYDYEQREQVLGAHQSRPDGLVDEMWCWVPGGRVTAPETRYMECWFTPQYNYQTGEYPEDYTSFAGGGRPGDGSGRVTFTSVTPERLAGTFTITMHLVDGDDWYSSPSIAITNGTFDLPVVSSYWSGQDVPEPPEPPEPPQISTVNSSAAVINDSGVVGGWVHATGETQPARWVVELDGSVYGPELLGDLKRGIPWYINRENVIVGSAGYPISGQDNAQPFIHDGTLRILTAAEHALSTGAAAINDAGIVVGIASFNAAGPPLVRGLVWHDPMDPAERPVLLPTLDGALISYAQWFNTSGVIAGFDGGRYVRWQLNTDGSVSGPELIGDLIVRAMNDASEFAGERNNIATFMRADNYISLPPLPGHDRSLASGLNTPVAGQPVQVVGSSASQESGRPVVWKVDASGTVNGPVDLGIPAGYDAARPAAVNTHGVIIGTAFKYTTGLPIQMATLWRPRTDGSGYDITTLGGLTQAPEPYAAVRAGRARCQSRPGRAPRCQ